MIVPFFAALVAIFYALFAILIILDYFEKRAPKEQKEESI